MLDRRLFPCSHVVRLHSLSRISPFICRQDDSRDGPQPAYVFYLTPRMGNDMGITSNS